MQDKRGLSAIVATLIIILLVLVAAGIIWIVVRNIIAEGAEGIELGRLLFDLSIKSAYIDDTNVKVIVRRSPGGGDLVGIRFVFFNSTRSISVDRKIPLVELQERLFSFDSSEVGDINALQRVSVAPIYESSSGRETVGDITDTAIISGAPPPGDNGDNGDGNGDNGGTPECDDGTDNDGDGNIDLNDAGCTDSSDDDETNCGDGICEGGEDVASCSSDCSGEPPPSCDGSWNPPEDSGVECDGGVNCAPDCTCSTGFTADGTGGCVLNPPINTGTIYSVWNKIFFDSHDLPKNISVIDYIGYYTNFSDSTELSCFPINFANYISENNISYLRLDENTLAGVPNINSGETYYVWEAGNCGEEL